ncbi:MAG: NosD domain-containing protein [Promethearchaeota archaeon]
MQLIEHRKKSIKTILLIGLFLFFNLTPIMQYLIPNGTEKDKIHDDITPSLSETNKAYIHIDNNWTETAAFYDWCIGLGSWNDPFIIKDLEIHINSSIAGIYINNSQNVYFIIKDCLVSNNSTKALSAGIRLENCINGRITDCVSNRNSVGIMLINNYNSSIDNCNVSSNNFGVYIEQSSSDISIYENNILNNVIQGVNITNSNDNLIYNNNFKNNTMHAIDLGANNAWNKEDQGNYWDDYDGKDADDNGIGDSPYIISGSAGGHDNYPIWWDAPVINVISPLPYSLFGVLPLNFSVSLEEGVSHSWWYMIDTNPTKNQFITNGSIDPLLWSLMVNGSHTIFFYVNDSRGYEDFEAIVIYKDIETPSIDIIFPESNFIFGNSSCNYTIVILESNLNSTWYKVNNGSSVYFNGISGLNYGVISENEWTLQPNGSIVIEFFANDTMGNLGKINVTVYKDIIPPIIELDKPTQFEIFGMGPPECNVSFYDINGVNTTWYYLTDGITITPTREWTGGIYTEDWNAMSNGTVTIFFYANDTLGNIASVNISIYKDIIAPSILISEPHPYDLVGGNPPICDVTFYDRNEVNTTWYQLTNGTFTTNSRIWTGTIDTNDWSMLPNGTITIIFYANDSLGNINSESVVIYKDIISPYITINEPKTNEIYGQNPPDCDLTLYDINFIDNVWYKLTDGTTTTSVRDWMGAINLNDWNAMNNGTVTITFYANDTLGNIATANVSVYKDIIPPSITIDKPNPHEVFGESQPECNVLFEDTNGVDSTWYQLTDGTITTAVREWTGIIAPSDWTTLGNGTITILFYANDTLGNVANNNVSVYKDIIAPIITIIKPGLHDVFGESQPECNVLFEDTNGVDSTWYQLTDGTITTAVREWTGIIAPSDWTTLGNGTITILFYANDTLGNIANTNVSVYKDIISPSIIINEPKSYELYGQNPPDCDLTLYDINFIDNVWYKLTDGTTTTSVRDWMGAINLNDWNAMNNGTVTITFYANDTLGNIATVNVSVYKDIIPPSITIDKPNPHEIFGQAVPDCDLTLYDRNSIDFAWYQLTNGIFTTAIREWTGIIHIDDWNAMPNGTVTIIFYANDTLGNIGTSSVSIYKDIIAPSILISEPHPYDLVGGNPPICDVTFYDRNEVNTTWYQLTNGTFTTNSRIWTGLIDVDDWNMMVNGSVIFILYANDSVGNINYESVLLHKDIISPIIIVNEPHSHNVFGQIPPDCDLTLYDRNSIDYVWYQLTDGTLTTTIREWTGIIHINDWNAMSNGTVTISFYANDTVGNIGVSNISIYKDIIGPDINIINPMPHSVFGINPPICDVTFYDRNEVSTTWYQLTNGTFTTNSRIWSGSIDIDDWNLMANGSVIFILYANDSVGNINFNSIFLYKDIISPIIIINEPQSYEIFGQIPPICDLTLYDINFIDNVWYELADEITTTNSRNWTGIIHIDDWNAMSNGTVTIFFYTNDTLGNIATANISVYKDIISPIIIINEPQSYEIFGQIPPYCDLTLYDGNSIDDVWYQLTDGTITTAIREWTGIIHNDDWGAMSNGTVTITFYANDTVGNIGTANVSIYKDIIGPYINVINPASHSVFGINPPVCDVTFYDRNDVNTTWYQLTDGITTTSPRIWSGWIYIDDWNAMSNGSITLIFYANDTVGNIGMIEVSIYKDIIGPYINIINPTPNSVFGKPVPSCTVTFYDINGLDTTWYQLTNGVITTPLREWTNFIYTSDWNAMPNGTVFIVFFANDTLDNMISVNVSIYKDSISPVIIINDPQQGQLYGITAPMINISVSDAHLESVWYQLDNGSIITPYQEWFGSISQEDWDLIGNGTVIVRFIAYDSVNNLASATLTLRKNIFDPVIIILDPVENELTGLNPPDIILYISSASTDTIWYQIYNATFSTSSIIWDGSINLIAWQTFGNGSLSIIFYMNDTLGNVGFDVVLLRKDTISPILLINSPTPFTLYGLTPPNVSITCYDENSISSISYQLTNGVTTTSSRIWDGSIHIDDWNAIGNGTVTIIFCAEDVVGNQVFANLTVRKDIISPDVFIYYPKTGQLYGYQKPSVFFYVIEGSGVSEISYQLISDTSSSAIINWNGEIAQSLWNEFGNGTITIFIYAIDIMGNQGVDFVIVRKDIIAPTIIIIKPGLYDVFGESQPECNVSFEDINGVHSTWYQLTDGTFTTNSRIWSGSIDLDDWTAFGNGSITIIFYADDILGNVASANVSVYKDIISPSISILSPAKYQKIGRDAPFFELNILEGNLDSCWYRILGIDTIILFSGSNGTIDQILWETIWDNTALNGTITIRFFAEDRLHNLNYSDVTVLKYYESETPPQLPTFPIEPLDLLALGCLGGIAISLPLIVTRSRTYKSSDKKKKHTLQRVLILSIFLLTLVTIVVITTY